MRRPNRDVEIWWITLAAVIIGTASHGAELDVHPTVGSVRIDSVVEGSLEYGAFVKKHRGSLGQRHMLTSGEWRELDALQDRAGLTDAETNRFGELLALSPSRRQELSDLQGIRGATAEQKARLMELAQIRVDNEPKIQQLQSLFEKELAAYRQGLRAKLHGRIRDAVAGVARAHGLLLVMDSPEVLFGMRPRDVTGDVIRRLNDVGDGRAALAQ